MTHVLIWLLLYPVIAATDTVARLQVTEMNVGRHNAGHMAVYTIGTILLVAMHYV